MVKKLLKFFAYLFVFLFSLIVFTPKENIYYLLEEKLQAFNVVISGEQLEDKLIALEIEDAEVYAEGIEAAHIQHTSVVLLGLYNHIEVTNVVLASFVESFLPQKVEKISIIYSVLNPLELSLSANGEFGTIDGELQILEQKLELHLQASKVMHTKYRNTLREFKKEENGEYTYAKAL